MGERIFYSGFYNIYLENYETKFFCDWILAISNIETPSFTTENIIIM